MNIRDKQVKSTNLHSLFSMLMMASILIMVIFTFGGCGEDEKKADEPQTFEIALITETENVSQDPFISSTWTAIQSFSEEYEKTCQCVTLKIPEDADEEKTVESCRKSVDKAVSEGAGIVVFAGSQFEIMVHSLQADYPDLYFVLIDGVPRDKDYNYEMAANSTGVLFAEEEAGFLAGYAAVADGKKKLAFLGGKDIPPVKRYGYGFIQGAAAAAKDGNEKGVEIRYCYTDTFDAEDWIKEGVSAWYSDGTQVIFSCGGSIVNSVVEACEATKSKDGDSETYAGQIIGVDTDESGLSGAVITSARKEIKTAIYDILKAYIHDNFKGNSIFNYDLKNNGVSLEMANSRFDSFSQAEYNRLVEEIKSGKVKVQKEMGGKTLKELAPKEVKVEEGKLKKGQ